MDTDFWTGGKYSHYQQFAFNYDIRTKKMLSLKNILSKQSRLSVIESINAYLKTLIYAWDEGNDHYPYPDSISEKEIMELFTIITDKS